MNERWIKRGAKALGLNFDRAIALLSAIVSITLALILWNADRSQQEWLSETALRDARLRLKSSVYSEYALRSSETLHTLTHQLVLRESPRQVVEHSQNTASLFRSLIFDVCLGSAVVNDCSDRLTFPTEQDLRHRYDFEEKTLELYSVDLCVLDELGLRGTSLYDSLHTVALGTLELEGEYITIAPLPRSDLPTPLRQSLDRAPIRHEPRMTSCGTFYRFFDPTTGEPVFPSSEGGHGFFGMFRAQSNQTVYRFYR